MKVNPLILIIAGILCIDSGAPAWAGQPAPSRATSTFPLWPKGQMPGRASKSKKESNYQMDQLSLFYCGVNNPFRRQFLSIRPAANHRSDPSGGGD